jgi:hypothetical protein
MIRYKDITMAKLDWNKNPQREEIVLFIVHLSLKEKT